MLVYNREFQKFVHIDLILGHFCLLFLLVIFLELFLTVSLLLVVVLYLNPPLFRVKDEFAYYVGDIVAIA